jgi:hypothetical protein
MLAHFRLQGCGQVQGPSSGVSVFYNRLGVAVPSFYCSPVERSLQGRRCHLGVMALDSIQSPKLEPIGPSPVTLHELSTLEVHQRILLVIQIFSDTSLSTPNSAYSSAIVRKPSTTSFNSSASSAGPTMFQPFLREFSHQDACLSNTLPNAARISNTENVETDSTLRC